MASYYFDIRALIKLYIKEEETADERLCKVANLEGLAVLNPLDGG